MSDTLSDTSPPSFFDEDFPVDQRKCRLLGPTALVVQALMGVLVILSLVYKRHRESSKRPWRIWAFDVSKQIVGQMFVHGMNLLISGVSAHHASTNPCNTYFLNILIDTTLGVALIYFIHRFLTHVFSNMLQMKGFQSGQYGTPPSILYWARQAAIYVTALTTMKFIVIGLLAILPGIFKLGDWLLAWTGGGDAVQVIFVMGLFPIAMNILQFWLIDSIVKATTQDNDLNPTSSPRQSADREPLFSATASDDDDETLDHTHRFDIENPPLASSASQSVKTKTSLVDEQKYLSSRTSLDEPEEADEPHAYPPLSSSAGSSFRSQGSSLPRPSTPKRRRSPPPSLQLHSQSDIVDSPRLRHVALAETPVTNRKIVHSADSPCIDGS
ncbi:uncharacterized protein FOMMEDRAFT_89208 [Fomitiporia mediterranea MF3/22]|uniref:uncharacterized protein n=1 Tax=Fomitiporia mediterranea (strain MF3/22) TaxID=694068 RepID=UPI0004407A95|nr:uncharacterized protein FOMMEDRAFT_89208 [Fomitiporia mediterranea MF3/22]EJD01553.1 hypothetical protein FOMMEDRAFT_89208 [Fomitiporia mediterranea MF3/22]